MVWQPFKKKAEKNAAAALPGESVKAQAIAQKTLPAAWTPTAAENAFKPDLPFTTFRTLAFRNLNNPAMAAEYLEAEYLSNERLWRLRQCIVGEGSALAVLFNRETESTTVRTTIEKHKTLYESATFIDVLHKMAVYEFGTDTSSEYALREVAEGDIGGTHFMEAAHEAGIIFDAQGHPSMTRNGRPLRDGEYPQKELEHVAVRQQEISKGNVKTCPALLRVSDITPVFQASGGLNNFDDFLTLISLRDRLKDVLESYKNLDHKYYHETYNHQKECYVWTDAPWQKLLAERIESSSNGAVKTLLGIKETIAEKQDYQAIEEAVDDVLTMHRVTIATTMMQFFHESATVKESFFPQHLKDNLEEADKALEAAPYEEDRKQNIRSFIMARYDPKDMRELVQTLVTSVQSIAGNVQAQMDNLVVASQQPLLQEDKPESKDGQEPQKIIIASDLRTLQQ